MNIQDNIIKHHLKNVYFICGTACGGKTTISKLLAEKYGFYLYDMDKEYDKHRAIAEAQFQPDTCYHMKNFHEQWTRSAQESARWNINCIREQSEMVLIDLLNLSQQQTVVADVLYSSLYSKDVIDDNRIVFLTVNKAALREQYFNRPEKRSFYEFVKAQPLADLYFENILKGLELTNDLEQKMMKESGFKIIERTKNHTPESLLKEVEEHFGL